MSTVDAATSAVTNTPATTAQAAGQSAQNLADYDDFLTLLTAQLSNQDPLDPEDSTEFVSQIATFTTVEQQINTNDKLDQLISLQAGTAVEELGRYVGREVFAEGLKMNYAGGEIELATPEVRGADKVEVVIKNELGLDVARLEADGRGGPVTWDGDNLFGGSAQNGVYAIEYQITRSGPEGEVVETQTPPSAGLVVEARYDDAGEVQLLLEGGVVVVNPADVQAVYTSTGSGADAGSVIEEGAEAVVEAVEAVEAATS